jgi:hypothetical protein
MSDTPIPLLGAGLVSSRGRKIVPPFYSPAIGGKWIARLRGLKGENFPALPPGRG